jgi:acetolactate synthase-1/2/3 large subunit
MTNVELLVDMLAEAGVRWVFGIPSGPVLPLIDALDRSPVDFVLTASETSAGFMATTVGELTGIPGVCASTLGPGATNMTTGVGCAWLDCAPVLAITCNVATRWLKRRVQMRIDHHELFRPLTKATLPLREEGFARTVATALATAKAEPPGPVHLDLPEDVGLANSSGGARSGESTRAVGATIDGMSEELTRALSGSRRPLVVSR